MVERVAQPDVAVLLADDGGHQLGQGQVDGDVGQADMLERFEAQGQDLGIGGGIGGADQLDADLAELALGAQLRALDLQDLAGIGQAQRARIVAQAGGGDARHLRGHVRAHDHHALGQRIHDAEGAFAGETLLEFDHGRLDAVIAMPREHPEQARDGLGFEGGEGRQDVAQAGGKQGALGVFGHGLGHR